MRQVFELPNNINVMNVIKTANVGSNADLLPIVLRMYAKQGDVIYDVTYGKGVFWKNADMGIYDFKPTDLLSGTDFKALPYSDSTGDILVLDPPYMHGGATIKKSINDCYKNQNTSHESVIRLYAGGILEAARVLKKGGQIWVKCQDEIESGKQRMSHCELIELLQMLGFSLVDMFVLVFDGTPAMRENYQKTARKNHSYLIVAKFKG
jgi:DNA modification methylase